MTYKNDLTKKLTSILENKKTLVLIDGANLYFAAQSKGWNIDFNQLYNWFNANTNLVQTVYYTAYNPEDAKQNEFINNLELAGFTVFKKPIKTFADSTIKGNLDVEICVDTMKQIFNFQILVLISGDGDFTYLAQTLEMMGKKVVVIGIGGFMSFELLEQADNYFLLDRIKIVWQKPKKIKLEIPKKLTTESTDTSKIKSAKTQDNSNQSVKKTKKKKSGNNKPIENKQSNSLPEIFL